MTATIWLLLHFFIGLAGTWLARRYALRRNLVDEPGTRRSHVVPTPRGGGLSVVVAMLLACAWLLWRDAEAAPLLAAFVPGLALVAGVGLLDDHRPLSPWVRLAAHALAAMLLSAGAWLETGNGWLAGAAFLLAMVLTNAWNFMDGIDGLAATQAMLLAALIAWAAGGFAHWIALSLLAATAGFLPFNFPKARIFLGDVGSGALGYALAMLIIAVVGQGVQPWWLWSLPLSAFLIDTGLTLLGRLRRREAWWQAHTLHAYQRWVQRSRSHMRVTLAYAAWTVVAVGLMASLRHATWPVMFLYCFAWYMTGAGAWWWLQRKGTVVVEDME